MDSAHSPGGGRGYQSTNPQPYDSGLEVYNRDEHLPEVVPESDVPKSDIGSPHSSTQTPQYVMAKPYEHSVLTTQTPQGFSAQEYPAQQEYQYGQSQYGEKTEPDGRRERICGVKRRTFWFILAGAIAVVVIAVLAGVLGGVLTAQKGSSGGNSASATTSSTSAAATPTPTSTPTTPSTTTTSTSTSTSSAATGNPTFATTTGPGGVQIECPAANGFNYTHPETGKIFRRECNRNYVGGDVANITATNMEECMSACAARSDCIGVNWMYRDVQGRGNNYCWLKSRLPGGQADSGCESGVLYQ